MSPTALKPSRCRVRFVASEGEQSSAEATAEHVITNLMDIAEDDNTVIVGYIACDTHASVRKAASSSIFRTRGW